MACSLLSVTPGEAIVLPDRAVTPGEGSWTARITADFGDGRDLLCSGVLIRPRVVLTAAHCVVPDSLDQATLSTWEVSFAPDSRHQTVVRKPVAVIYHAKYERNLLAWATEEAPADQGVSEDPAAGSAENGYDGDIALVLLDRAVNSVRPVRLPTRSTAVGPAPWRVYGWGVDDEETGREPDRILTAAQQDQTGEMTDELGGPLVNVLAAIGYIDSKVSGTCWGDSGGPLVDGSGTLIGLTSFAEAETCDEDTPTIFTRTASYLTWITRAEKTALQSTRAQPTRKSRQIALAALD